jgi:hypothetical protein
LRHTVHVIASATNRKKTFPGPNLYNFNGENGKTPFNSWSAALDRYQGDKVTPMELYAGDHWSVAKSLLTEFPKLNVCLWVISPGYGLVGAEDKITPYIATFSPDHHESVNKGV